MSLITLARIVDSAEPAMPILGKGPNPLIRIGLNTASMATVTLMKISGVRASPVPRRPMVKITEAIMNGSETNIRRR
jgi:hypothetical protein